MREFRSVSAGGNGDAAKRINSNLDGTESDINMRLFLRCPLHLFPRSTINAQHNNDDNILLVPHLKCVWDCNDGLPNIKGVGDVTLSMKPYTVPIARSPAF